MRVAVIGAGASGLIAAKILSCEGIDYDVFESNDGVGGTWIYSEDLLDKHGRPVTSSMYKNLKTNLPKELMLFEGLDYEVEGVSYLEASLVLDYLKRFSEKFCIEDHIKFEHLVVNVSRKGSDWELVSKDLISGKEETCSYDTILVCNGHYSEPSYPHIPGVETFTGTTMHSHYYRVPEVFNDKILLVIGCGPSGVDIVFDVCSHAKLVYFSHHGPAFLKEQVNRENIVHKPDVKEINGNDVYFMDDTVEQVDAILYCTGYNYEFNFLDKSCEINVDNGYVYPLYKQIVSIPHDSMMFIGLPFRTIVFPLLELQAKCAVNILTKKAKLPPKETMKQETQKWEHLLLLEGTPKKKYHMISECMKEYFNDVAKLGNLPPCPDILFDIYDVCSNSRRNGLSTYRKHVFNLIDSNTFTFN